MAGSGLINLDSECFECGRETGESDEWGAGSDVVGAEGVKVVEEAGAEELDVDGRSGFEGDEAIGKHDSKRRVKDCDSRWGDVADAGKEKGRAGDTTEGAEAAASVEGDGAVAKVGIVNKGECGVWWLGFVEGTAAADNGNTKDGHGDWWRRGAGRRRGGDGGRGETNECGACGGTRKRADRIGVEKGEVVFGSEVVAGGGVFRVMEAAEG